MKFTGLAGRTAHFKRVIKVRGLSFAIQSAWWHLQTGWNKTRIGIEDRLGCFSYTRWIKENEAAPRPPAFDRKESGPDSTGVAYLSFLIPLPLVGIPQRSDSLCLADRLSRTLHSLVSQTSPAWEACLFGDRPEGFTTPLSEVSRGDAGPQGRFRWYVNARAGEGALSKAITQARGVWVMILRPGDVISPDLCDELSRLARQPASPEIVYFDQDQLSENSYARKNPVFWPDWSPDLLLSVNYLENACFQRELLLACTAQSQDSGDALLRCVEQARQIAHVPRILYHQDNPSPDNDLLSFRFSPTAIVHHLQRMGVKDAHIAEDTSKRAHFSWTVSGRLVSIIIPSKDHRVYLERCLTSIHRLTHYRNYEIVIVDNDSQEAETLGYYSQLKQAPNITVLKNQTAFNYSTYNNLGAQHAHGDLLLFLNNDIEAIDPCWLDELVQWAERSDIGAVGAKLLYPDGTIQHAGVVVGMEGHASHVFMGQREGYTGPFGSVDWYRDYSAVTGACLMMRRNIFFEVGGFDEKFDLVFNDIELGIRILAHGYRVVYNPFARLIHYEGKSRGRYIPASDVRLGYECLKETVARGDPYYNPNLSYAVRLPTLRRSWDEDRLHRLEKLVRFAI